VLCLLSCLCSSGAAVCVVKDAEETALLMDELHRKPPPRPKKQLPKKKQRGKEVKPTCVQKKQEGQRGQTDVRARAPEGPVQGVRLGLLPARAPEDPVQGVRARATAFKRATEGPELQRLIAICLWMH
jgi:hypothetical protein